MKDIIEKVAPYAPLVAGMLGGPGGAAVASGLVKALGLNTPEEIAELPPERLAELDTLSKQIQLAEIKSDTSIALAQIKNNTQDSKSSSVFVAGWRPFIGWVCGFGLLYQFLAMPIINGTISFYTAGQFLDAFPAIDIASLSALLIGMLGLSAKRTAEKWRGVARKRINE